MKNDNRRLLSETARNLELAVSKCLCWAPLRHDEVSELLELTQSDLIRDYECDLFMAEQVMNHMKHEQYRLRAQRQFSSDENETVGDAYPERPYTRTSPMNESSAGALKKIMSDAQRVRRQVLNSDNLPPWCEHKINQSQAMLHSISRYLATRK